MRLTLQNDCTHPYGAVSNTEPYPNNGLTQAGVDLKAFHEAFMSLQSCSRMFLLVAITILGFTIPEASANSAMVEKAMNTDGIVCTACKVLVQTVWDKSMSRKER